MPFIVGCHLYNLDEKIAWNKCKMMYKSRIWREYNHEKISFRNLYEREAFVDDVLKQCSTITIYYDYVKPIK